MKKNIVILFVLITLIGVSFYFFSKKQKVYRHLKGQWLIEAIYYDNQNVITEYLNNGLDFENNHTALPPLRMMYKKDGQPDWISVEKQKNDGYITYDLIQKDTLFYIVFHDTKDEVFKDTLQIRFYREDGLNKMDLSNEHAYIKLSKWELFPKTYE